MKRIFSFLLIIIAYVANAQTGDKVVYYYQGKKISFPVNYERLVIQLAPEEIQNARRQQITSILALSDTAIKQMADKRLVSAKMPKGMSIALVKEKIASLRKQGFTGFVHPVLKSPSGKDVGYGDELVIKLKAGTGITQFEDFVKRNNCSIVKKYTFADKTYIISAGKANNYDAAATANLFFESGLFEYAEPDFTLFDALMAPPNDPLYDYQWSHQNTGSAIQYNGTPGLDLKVQQAWNITKGAGIKIAVIDEGVDIVHADLQANLLQGFDAIAGTANPGDGKPLSQYNGHGTSCAGIIAALANNNIGVAGVAPESKLIPVNIANAFGNFASDIVIASGFDYAWQHGADVISNSWGGGVPSSVLDDAIYRAVNQGRNGKGCVVLFASGNDNAGLGYPASNANVISVGGVNMCGQRKSPNSSACDGETWGANYGTGIDLVAPCVKIVTTDISGTGGYNPGTGAAGDYMMTFNGTSSATPNAAGVAALILAANTNLTLAQLRTVLESNCTKLASYNYAMDANEPNGSWNSETGHGMVDAFRAVQAAVSGVYCSVQIQANGATRFCAGGNVNLSVKNPVSDASYQWRKDGSNFAIGSSINANHSGNYDVVSVAANGCTATAAPVTVTELANTPPLVASAGPGVTLCPGGSAIIGGNPSATNGSAFIAEKRAYGIDNIANNFVRFSLRNPLQYDTILKNITSPADINAGQYFNGGDFTPYGYYVIQEISNKLVKIDTATGAQQLIGIAPAPVGYAWSNLSWDRAGKKLYALCGGTRSILCTIDPFTANVTQITNINLIVSSMAINASGNLYALSTNGYVFRVDKQNGALTQLPDPVGAAVRYAYQAADFDPVTDSLYIALISSSQSTVSDLRTVDTHTGQSTVIGSLGGLSQINALAIAEPLYQYNWSPATGLNNTTTAAPLASPSATTTYTLQVTDMCGNTASSQVTVFVSSTIRPPVAITAPVDSIADGPVKLSATKNIAYSYQWYLNGQALPNAADSFYIASRAGKYTVRATDICDSLSLPFNLKGYELRLSDNNPASVCQAEFYDSGGPGNNYSDNEFVEKTVTAATPGSLLQVRFDYFSSEYPSDVLSVYEGNNTNGSAIIGFAGGLNSPYTIKSSGPSLTFQFKSNSSVNNSGWYATISCIPPAVYRSRQSGNFGNIDSWEVKSGSTFINATVLPNFGDDSIIIQTGHTIVIDNLFELDQVWVMKGAVLHVSTAGMKLHDGPGDDMVIDGTLETELGIFLSSSNASGIYPVIRVNGTFVSTGYFTTVWANIIISGNQPQVFTTGYAKFQSISITNPELTINITGTDSPLMDELAINSGGTTTISSGNQLILTVAALHLQSGVFKLQNSILQVANCCSSVTGNSTGSFVDGMFRQVLSSEATNNVLLPVGAGGAYRPVTLLISKSPGAQGIAYGTVMNTAPPAHNLPATLASVSNKRYFKIGLGVAYTDATITIAFGPDDNVQDLSMLRIAKYDGIGNWIDLGGAGATGSTSGTVSVSISPDISGTGDYVLATAAGSALPACVTNTSPTNASVLPSQTSARISWPASTGAVSYDVYLAAGNAIPTLLATNTTALTYYATGLTAGTLYSWYIAPVNANGANTACGTTNKTTFTTAAATGGANITPVANGGTNISIALPASAVTLDGTASYDPDGSITEYYWYQVQGPVTAAIGNFTATPTVTGLTTAGTYIFGLQVKDNSGVNSYSGVTVIVNPAGTGTAPACITNTLPTNASVLPSQTSARLSWPASAGAVSYDVYLAAGNAIPTLLVTNTTALTYYATGLTAGTLYSWYIAPRNANSANTACGTTNKTTFTTAAATGGANIAPVANGGNNISITLPASSVTLDGTASYDPDGSITEYYWYQVQGPVTAAIGNFTATPTVTGLTTAGTYIFGLQVKDNSGVNSYSGVTVIVNPAGTGTAPACVTNTSPTNASVLPSQTSARLSWPASAGAVSYDVYLAAGNAIPTLLATNTTALTYYATGLTAGTLYSWYIAPRNANSANTACGTTNKTTFTTAAATGGANIAPVANGGNNISITLPASSVTLDGTASYDPDGSITEYYWYQVQGPVTAAIGNFTATPTITGLTTAGTYIFGLQVKDNSGVNSYSGVTVIVNPAGTTIAATIAPKTNDPAGQTTTGAQVITGSISPNPVARGGFTRLQINSYKKYNAVIDIVNMSGSIISTQKVNLVHGVNTTRISASALAQGMYIIHISGADKPINLKLMVTN